MRGMLIFFAFTVLTFGLASLATRTAYSQEVWVRRYNGPSNDYDYATAIAVDANGNVYVTGYSEGAGTDGDYATIKYNSSGDTVWFRRYDGPGNDWDGANAIAVDDNGNVYVTGESCGSGTSSDYTTIKYNSSGDSVWVRRYNGPVNGGDGANAIAVDDNGNVYVTGWSRGSGNDDDYATLKYNSSGDSVWVRRYNGPDNNWDRANAIAVDDNGNVYVAGTSKGLGTYDDYATIKYNSSGDTVWLRRYNGPVNDYDYATAIAVDDNGNVYVTGYSKGSGTSLDYATIKYNSSGDTVWLRRYDGPAGSTDYARAIAVDANGNVYVTGYSKGLGTYDDYATIKYNSSGDTLWVRRYNGPSNGGDNANAIAVDDTGNVYVTGSSYGGGTDDDYATIKYNSSGDSMWVARYNGPGNGADWANAMAVDVSGNVYVTGESWGSGTLYDYATIKYTGAGIEENANCKVQIAKLQVRGRGVYLFTPQGIEVDIRVYDICGRMRQVVYKGVLSKGGHTFILELESSGIYFVVLRTHELKESLKIVRF